MKKSKLVSIILIMVVSLSIILASKMTLAATSNNMIDLTDSALGNNTANASTPSNNTTNSVVNNTINTNTARNNTVLTTNNATNSYNNSSLPKTGVESSMLGMVFVVILGISAVYAYNKIQYYRNI